MKLIDLHCDTATYLLKDPACSLRQNTLAIDLESLARADSMAQVFALFVNQEKVTGCAATAFAMLEALQKELDANGERIALAENGAAIRHNQRAGKLSALIALEEGAALEGDMNNLHRFHAKGVRLVTLTWNYPNEIGFPNGEEHGHKGLTPFGLDLLAEMDALRMITDVSHLSEGGFWDVAKHVRQSFMATHSNCRALKNHSRNLHDDQIRALADKGGVMGICIVKNFLKEGDDTGRLEAMAAHIRHAEKVGGIEVVAIGTDFDGTATNDELRRLDDLNKLEPLLRQAGYTDDALEKIYWKNALRVFDELLA